MCWNVRESVELSNPRTWDIYFVHLYEFISVLTLYQQNLFSYTALQSKIL